MTESSSAPIIYVKEGCPFCLKLRIFLLEAGQLDHVELREFAAGTGEEQAIRAELEPHFEKVGFPTAKIASGEYLSDSDAIIAHFARAANIDPAKMPTLRAYADGVMPRMMTMHREIMDLKKQLA